MTITIQSHSIYNKKMNYIRKICIQECNRLIQSIKKESAIEGWKVDNINGNDVAYYYDYQPQSKKETSLGKRPNGKQRLVWCFKNDSKDFTEKEHQKALGHVESLLSDYLATLLKEYGSDIVLVCAPTSTRSNYVKRWKQLSTDLCNSLGIKNGYPHVRVKDSDVPHHWGGKEAKASFDKAFFKGKDVVLLDDLITSGYTMKTTSEALEKVGAKIVCHIAIARTIED